MRFRLQRYQILLVLLVATIAYGLATGYPFFYRLGYLIGLILVGTYTWSWFNLRGLHAEFKVDGSRAQIGDSLGVSVEITNDGRFQKSNIHVTIDSDIGVPGMGRVLSVEARTIRAYRSGFVVSKRGIFGVGPINITSSDPFGIFRLKKTWPGVHSVTVIPKPRKIALDILVRGRLLSEGLFRRIDYHSTPHVSHVREYQSGDPLNRIHWLTSARTGQLMVKQFDEETGTGIVILLDADSYDGVHVTESSPFEEAVTVAASLVQWAFNERVPVGLICNGKVPVALSPDVGLKQLIRLLDSLAMVNVGPGTSMSDMFVTSKLSPFRQSVPTIVASSLEHLSSPAITWAGKNGIKPIVLLVDSVSDSQMTSNDWVVSSLESLGIHIHYLRSGDFDSRMLSPAVSVDRIDE